MVGFDKRFQVKTYLKYRKIQKCAGKTNCLKDHEKLHEPWRWKENSELLWKFGRMDLRDKKRKFHESPILHGTLF